MKEILLTTFRRTTGIIDIEGSKGDETTFLKTAGVTIYPDERINLSCFSGWDHLIIPNVNTPQPTLDNCEIIIDYRINNFIEGLEFVPLGHWTGNADFALCHNSNGTLKIADLAYSGANLRRPLDITMPVGKRQVFKYRFLDGQRSYYLDDVLIQTVTGSLSSYDSNWGIGTYFNINGTPVNTPPGNARLNWDLFKLSIKFI